MSQKVSGVALTKVQRDAMFGWFVEQAPRLIMEDCTPATVAAEIGKRYGWPISVPHLELFRRQMALTWGCCPYPDAGERRTPFWGLAAVLTALLWVFTKSSPLDPCYLNLGEEVKE